MGTRRQCVGLWAPLGHCGEATIEALADVAAQLEERIEALARMYG